jgi:valyl-tRNA synthetase
VGKHFCNKLWNAARLVLMNLEEQAFRSLSADELFAEDRWILSRLAQVIAQVTDHLQAYNPSAALGAARDFFWSEFCDWYLELIKPRLKNDVEAFVARQVVAAVLDQLLRLFHPFVPFITEALWEHLGAYIPTRGIAQPFPTSELLIQAAWPESEATWRHPAVESEFDLMQEVIRSIRNVRSKYNIAPAKKLEAHIKANTEATATLTPKQAHIINLCNLATLEIAPTVERPKLAAAQVVGDLEIYLVGVLDLEKERERLTNQQKKLLKELTPVQKKLENPEFLNRAPAHVIEKERQKVQDMTTELALIEENLKMLA